MDERDRPQRGAPDNPEADRKSPEADLKIEADLPIPVWWEDDADDPPMPQMYIEGRVMGLLPYGFTVETAHGTTEEVSTQTTGTQTGLRPGDRVTVRGGPDETGRVFLSGSASRLDPDGRWVSVPVNEGDL